MDHRNPIVWRIKMNVKRTKVKAIKPNANGKAWGYARVSTIRQSEEGESLATQTERLTAIARSQGYELAGIFIEEGVSGSLPFAQRPEGSKLIEAAKAGDVIFALRLDRTFRNVGDAIATREELERRGVSLFLDNVGGFITGSQGRLMFNIMASVAANEREINSERVSEVRAKLRTESRYLGGPVPFGYRATKRSDGKTELVEDVEILAEAARLKCLGYSTRLAAGHFKAMGVAVSHNTLALHWRTI